MAGGSSVDLLGRTGDFRPGGLHPGRVEEDVRWRRLEGLWSSEEQGVRYGRHPAIGDHLSRKGHDRRAPRTHEWGQRTLLTFPAAVVAVGRVLGGLVRTFMGHDQVGDHFVHRCPGDSDGRTGSGRDRLSDGKCDRHQGYHSQNAAHAWSRHLTINDEAEDRGGQVIHGSSRRGLQIHTNKTSHPRDECWMNRE